MTHVQLSARVILIWGDAGVKFCVKLHHSFRGFPGINIKPLRGSNQVKWLINTAASVLWIKSRDHEAAADSIRTWHYQFMPAHGAFSQSVLLSKQLYILYSKISVKLTIKDCIRMCTVYLKVTGNRYVRGTFILIFASLFEVHHN